MGSRQKLTFSFSAATLLAVLLSGCFLAPLYETTQTASEEHLPGTALRVRSQNGSISVQQSDREDVQIIAHVRAVSQQRLEAATLLAERTEDGTLSIAVQWPDDRRKGREGCSFEVLIPSATGLDLQTSNGKLGAVGLSGRAELYTSNGAIDVSRHEGPVVAKTSNGRVTLSDVRGSVEARSTNGKIHIEQAADAVTARTSNGSVRVTLDPSSLGPIDVQTSNGKIELGIGPVFTGQLLLKTSNGSVKVDSDVLAEVDSPGKNQATLVFNDSDQQSKATTSNGAIRVKRVGTGQEATPEQAQEDAEIVEYDRQL